MRAYAAGNVALANAPGNGVADDKAIYPFVPDMIRYYLGEEPLLEQVPTYVCARDDDREVRARAPRRAGGQGRRRGRRLRHADGPAGDAPPSARSSARASSPSRASTSRSTASSCRPARPGSPPTRRLEPRRVDLRPYVLTGKDGRWVLPGGLTRVALRDGSYVVNSSQGGGSKDTWVQADAAS